MTPEEYYDASLAEFSTISSNSGRIAYEQISEAQLMNSALSEVGSFRQQAVEVGSVGCGLLCALLFVLGMDRLLPR